MPGIIVRDDFEALFFDIVVSERFGPKNKITDYAVEDGAVFADHIQATPDVFTVVGIIDQHPLTTDFRSETPRQSAADYLQRTRLEIVSYESVLFGTLDRLGIESWAFEIDTLQRLEITISFKTIEVAQALYILLPPEIIPPDKSSELSDEADTGHQPAKEEKEPETATSGTPPSDLSVLNDKVVEWYDNIVL